MSDIGIVTEIFLIVLTVCVTFLFSIGKLKQFRFSKNEVSIENSTASETSLLVLDQMLEQAETNHKRRMLANAYECFKENEHGRRAAVYLSALNHCIRDITSIGLENYIIHKQRRGDWTDEETHCFMRTTLYSCIELINARLDAYERVKDLNNSDLFKSILKNKIEKNTRYLEQFTEYLEKSGIKNQNTTS
jgi:bacterioferritin (cytochrome b1)